MTHVDSTTVDPIAGCAMIVLLCLIAWHCHRTKRKLREANHYVPASDELQQVVIQRQNGELEVVTILPQRRFRYGGSDSGGGDGGYCGGHGDHDGDSGGDGGGDGGGGDGGGGD